MIYHILICSHHVIMKYIFYTEIILNIIGHFEVNLPPRYSQIISSNWKCSTCNSIYVCRGIPITDAPLNCKKGFLKSIVTPDQTHNSTTTNSRSGKELFSPFRSKSFWVTCSKKHMVIGTTSPQAWMDTRTGGGKSSPISLQWPVGGSDS